MPPALRAYWAARRKNLKSRRLTRDEKRAARRGRRKRGAHIPLHVLRERMHRLEAIVAQRTAAGEAE
jgi:hypothetical protein